MTTERDKVLQFLHAADTGCLSVLQELLNDGVDPNATLKNEGVGLAALHYAAGRGHHEIVALLLSCGAYADLVSMEPQGGLIALHLAVRARCLQSVRHLVYYGDRADVHFEDSNGVSPLMLAKKLRCYDIVDFLEQ